MSRHVEECSYFSTVINNLIMATDISHSCQLNGNIAAKHWVCSSLFWFLLPSPPPSWMSVYSPRPRQAWGILNSWQKSTMCCNTFIPTLILCVGVFLNGKGSPSAALPTHLSQVCVCACLSAHSSVGGIEIIQGWVQKQRQRRGRALRQGKGDYREGRRGGGGIRERTISSDGDIL